eukprot:scaffold521_cov167-Amphora_coffeaeformis.AAC.25
MMRSCVFQSYSRAQQESGLRNRPVRYVRSLTFQKNEIENDGVSEVCPSLLHLLADVIMTVDQAVNIQTRPNY